MKCLNLLVLRCADIERARTFYECFEMNFTKHSHGKGPEHYASEDDRGVFELYPVSAGQGPDNVALGFASRDLSDVRMKLIQAGYSPGEIAAKDWGTTFVVRDPDGRRVEVKLV